MKTKSTESAGGIILNNGHILLVNQHQSSWSLPKGHIENNELPLDAAYREIYEETGIIHLNLLSYLGNYTRFKIGKDITQDDTSEKKTLHFFLFKTNQHHTQSHDTANPENKWIPIREVVNHLTHPKDKDFFHSIIPKIMSFDSPLISIETTTSSKKEAEKIATLLLEKRLIACCHIGEVTSLYQWENAIQNEKEFKLTLKTQQQHYPLIETTIKQHHSYSCPQITASNIVASLPDYTKWALDNS